MKKKFILPFALTGLVAALSACGGGGESAVIHEDPNKGVSTTSNGCEDKVDNKCQSFVVDYPIAGLNFDCSSDKNNHFVTEMVSSVATGACLVGDKVNFYIQGAQSSRKISLGTVDLAKIRPLKVNNQPAQISLMDMANGLTGKAIASSNVNDETFRVLTALVRIFQAAGVKQNIEMVAGDIQPLSLSKEFKEDLKNIGSDIEVQNFKDDSYIGIIKPWLDVSSITEETAQQAADRLIKQNQVGIYTTNFLIFSGANVDIRGFSGKSTINSKKETVANMYLLTTREGYSTGYAIQWTGVPTQKETGNQISDSLLKYALLTQAEPQKLNADAQGALLSQYNNKIEKPFIFKSVKNTTDNLQLIQGSLINGSNIAGTEDMYKRVLNTDKVPTDKTVYGEWRQTQGNENFTGTIDIYKSNPATYLTNKVFRTVNTVKTGQKYIFPLYANIIFNFNDKSISPVKLGIVIDEHGDIRTNIGPNATANDLTSKECSTVNPATYIDNNNVQQYRIGTTGAANYTTTDPDKSITIRMILANPIFGNIDGALVGLNDAIVYLPGPSISEDNTLSAGGVRLNLQRLLSDGTTERGINITGWNGNKATTAQWANMQAVYQTIYNAGNKDKITDTQKELAKRTFGELDVELPSCYQIKTKQ
ncbi:hypothetical protein A7P53_03940 [Acinetobacter defluvii]|uniref:putative pilus system protein FilF n=1 Tax=Acinetobacter defluvii TaxID=1871111 RepID=UPI00148F7DA5|nr:hypothetical protein [Acinetobacter defluvii]NNP71599.1 hypothetical protein [Acinetobacter defluvii]